MNEPSGADPEFCSNAEKKPDDDCSEKYSGGGSHQTHLRPPWQEFFSDLYNIPDFTVLIRRWQTGDQAAGEELYNHIYKGLRGIARWYLSQGWQHHSLSATELVHEFYLKLEANKPERLESRAHFFSLLGRALRHRLIDFVTRGKTIIRGGHLERVSIPNVEQANGPLSVAQVLDLDEALSALDRSFPLKSRVFVMRFLLGMSLSECAQMNEISLASVKRHLTFAKVFIKDFLANKGKS